MDSLKLFKALHALTGKARASGMTPSEIAGCFFHVLEELGEAESGARPGFVVSLRWIEEHRAMYVARLAPPGKHLS